MSENYYYRGKGLVTLEGATAASNIVAGTMIGVNTGANTLYTYCRETVGLNTAGSFGMRFIGILDDDISAGQVSPSVWTEGVFRFQIDSGQTSVDGLIGRPVWGASSGAGLRIITNTGGTGAAAAGNVSGTISIGTIVGVRASGTMGAGDWVHVKINPAALKWGPFAQAATTGYGNGFPPTL